MSIRDELEKRKSQNVSGINSNSNSSLSVRDRLLSDREKNANTTIKPIQTNDEVKIPLTHHQQVTSGYVNATDEEKKIYTNLLKESTYKANDYIRSMTPIWNKRSTLADQERISEEAKNDSVGANILKSIATIPANIIGGVTGAIEDTANTLFLRQANPYSSGHILQNKAEAYRGGVSEKIGENGGLTGDTKFLGEDLDSFLYNTALSMGESAASVATMGPASLVTMGMSAASSTAKKLADEGATDRQIKLGSLLSGVAEGFFEKFSIEHLIKMSKNTSFKNVLKNMMWQAIIEGGEELGTEIANTAIDLVNRFDESDIGKAITEYKNAGMSDKEIYSKVARDIGTQLGLASAGGMLSGGIMGGVGSTGAFYNNKAIGKATQNVDLASIQEKYNKALGEEAESYGTGENVTPAERGSMINETAEQAYKLIRDGEKSGDANKTAQGRRILSELQNINRTESEVDKKVKAKIAEMENESEEAKLQATINTYADEFDNDEVKNIYKTLAADNNPERVFDSVRHAYEIGKNDLDSSDALRYKGPLSSQNVIDIYEKGLKARNTSIKQRQSKVLELAEKNSINGKKSQLITNGVTLNGKKLKGVDIEHGSFNSAQKNGLLAAEITAKLTGQNIYVYDSNGDYTLPNGFVNGKGIFFDINAGRQSENDNTSAIKGTLSHELTHWMKVVSPELFETYGKNVLNAIASEQNTDITDVIDRKILNMQRSALYKGENVSTELAREEIIAEASERMLENSKYFEEYVQGMSESERKTILDKIKDFIDKIKNFISELRNDKETYHEYSDILNKMESGLEALQKEWDAMLKASSEINKKLTNEDYEQLYKLSEERGLDIQYNSERAETTYEKAIENDDVETARKVLDIVAKRKGYPVRAYHGTGRADRVGTVFRKDRATSGPMAFFTDNKKMAENYSKTKADTSLAYDGNYDSYHTQFTIKSKNGIEMPLERAWMNPANTGISYKDYMSIKEKASHVTLDDNAEEIIYDENQTNGIGDYTYALKDNHGNAFAALIDGWLDGGALFDEEDRFMKVLELAGVTEALNKAGLEPVVYHDPYYREEKVYDAYLGITNPFNTVEMVNEDFVSGLSEWYNNQDTSKYNKEGANADSWDKNNVSFDEFVERLNDDIKNGTTHSWTSIPDYVTDYLISLGYNGIEDVGGKYGGDGHTVWIPFESNQVKSADLVTYDNNGDIIPLEERFNSEDEDIRYSIRETTDGLNVAVVEEDILKNVPESRYDNVVIEALKKVPQIAVYGQNVLVNSKTYREFTHSKATNKLHYKSPEVYADKLRSAKNIDDVVTVSTNYIGEEVVHEKTKKKFKEMARGKALLMIGENKYIADVIVGTDYENQSVLYDLTWITPTDFELKEEASAKSRSQKGLVLGSKDASANNLTQKSEKSSYSNKKYDDGVYSDRVTDGETLNFLNDQIKRGEVTEVYRAMQKVDGNYYPPMAGMVDGKWQNPSMINTWEQSTEVKDFDEAVKKGILKPYKDKNGNTLYKFKLVKGKVDGIEKGTDVPADYAPYIHTSLTPLNDQFTSAYKRPNLVVVRGYVPNSELTSGYKAYGAKKSVGETSWHSGVVAGQMPDTRRVILSRYFMPIEEVSDKEIAFEVKKMMKGKDIEIPYNVVTPSLRRELESIGVTIGEARGLNGAPPKSEVNYTNTSDIRYSDRNTSSALEQENKKLKEDITRLRDAIKLDKTITKGKVLSDNSIDEAAKNLRKYVDTSSYDKKKLKNELRSLYSILMDDEIDGDKFMQESRKLAEELVKSRKSEIVTDEYYNEIYNTIKNTTIKISDVQKQDAISYYGSAKALQQTIFGQRLKIKSDEGISLDSLWSELSEMYPNTFKADTSDADMLVELIETFKEAKDLSSREITPYDREDIDYVAAEIYNQFWQTKAITISADRLLKARQEHLRIMNNERERHRLVKQRYEEKVNRQKAKFDEYKDRQKQQKIIDKIRVKYKDLYEWTLHPNKDHHVQTHMQKPILNLLKAIDFSSKQMLNRGEPTKADVSLAESMREISKMLDKIGNNNDSEAFDIPAEFADSVRELTSQIEALSKAFGDNGMTIRNMNLDQLEMLYKTVSVVKSLVVNENKQFANARYQKTSDVGNSTIRDLKGYKRHSNFDDSIVNDQAMWANTLPIYAFKRFGNGAMSLFKSLQDGWGQYAFKIRHVTDYMKNNIADEKTIKAWSNEIHDFNGAKVTTTQLMSLWCLIKQDQAINHAENGGFTFAEYGKGKAKQQSQNVNKMDYISMLSYLTRTLTKEQIATADKIQAFFNGEVKDWGNEVTQTLYGFDGYTVENYFPISVNSNYLAAADTPQERGKSVFKLLNQGFTKARKPNAKTRLVINDIFDVYANHTADMAKYNTLALPILDMYKWYNYIQKGSTESDKVPLREVIENAFGKSANNYIWQFMEDLNQTTTDSRETRFGALKYIKNAKVASVAFNMRVALLQPTAYIRAAAVLNPKYLAGGLFSAGGAKRGIEKSGIFAWKNMGYYNMDVNRSLQSIIKGEATLVEKINEWGLKGAELMDTLTWGKLYRACEMQIKDTTKLTGAEYEKAVNDLFDEVIYKTQVIDSTMTRSHNMRSRTEFMKLYTAFKSEPTVTYNMLLDSFADYKTTARNVNSKEARRKYGKAIARSALVFGIQAIITAFVEGFADAIRNKDDDEFAEKYIEEFKDNLKQDANPLNKTPIMSEIFSALEGYNSSRLDNQFAVNAFKVVDSIKDIESLEDVKSYKFLYNASKFISTLVGTGLSNMFRDVASIIDTVFGTDIRNS